jgi:hypothetical protein
VHVIDVERQLVYSRGWGDVTDADLLDHQQRLAQNPRFHSDCSQLWDFLGPSSRRAIVVQGSASFGLARLFENYRDLAGGKDQIRVFMSLESARAWLGISPPKLE